MNETRPTVAIIVGMGPAATMCTLGVFCIQLTSLWIGATTLPKKTNYNFERRERERNKEAETVRKAKAKADKKAAEQGAPALLPDTDEA